MPRFRKPEFIVYPVPDERPLLKTAFCVFIREVKQHTVYCDRLDQFVSDAYCRNLCQKRAKK